MKTKIAILLLASALLVSFGVIRGSKSSDKKITSSSQEATLGGLAADEK